jgi:transcriptional regulator with XRE-family HTH domain
MDKNELKKRRERLGLTQTEFAETIGLTATSISRYETGLTAIPKSMELILEALEKRHIEDLQKPISVTK